MFTDISRHTLSSMLCQPGSDLVVVLCRGSIPTRKICPETRSLCSFSAHGLQQWSVFSKRGL